MVRRIVASAFVATAVQAAVSQPVRAADGYSVPRYADHIRHCRAPEPYYDHGPNWGEDPSTRHPVYAIDPSCYR